MAREPINAPESGFKVVRQNDAHIPGKVGAAGRNAADPVKDRLGSTPPGK